MEKYFLLWAAQVKTVQNFGSINGKNVTLTQLLLNLSLVVIRVMTRDTIGIRHEHDNTIDTKLTRIDWIYYFFCI